MTDIHGRPTSWPTRLELVAAWLFVGIPLLWGTGMTLVNAVKLFR